MLAEIGEVQPAKSQVCPWAPEGSVALRTAYFGLLASRITRE